MGTLCNFRAWGGDAPVVMRRRELPALPPDFVSRERLVAKVCAAVRRRLTLVTGVPGAGKSALLADWAGGCGAGMTAWLGLQATDNDRGRFWSRLVAALRPLRIDAGAGALAALSAGESDRRVAEMLVGDLGLIERAVIVLDDFHLLNEPLVSAVGHLANNLASNVHLVVASRKLPAFPLHQLRLTGELSELADADLRFRREEALALCEVAVGDGADPDEVGAMVERCEGWVAGVRYAALAASDAGGPPGSGDAADRHRRLVFDYFDHEVLDRLPPDIRRFLVDCSVLEGLSTEVCAAVTGRPDAGMLLASLVQDNQFVVPPDNPGGEYRYHRLFAEFLLDQLALEGSARSSDAHRRAAASLEQVGDIGAAVAHLVTAGAGEEAFALVADALVEQVRCGWQPADPWLPAGLPDSFFETDPFRIWVMSAVLLRAGRVDEAARWLPRLDLAVAGRPQAGWWRGQAERLWALHDGLVGDGPGVLRHSRTAALAPATVARDAWWDIMDQALVDETSIVIGRAHLWQGEPAEARRALDAGGGGAASAVNPARLGVQAAVAGEEGRLREAYWLAHQALGEVEHRGRPDRAGTADARLALGVVHWQWDDLATAERQLETALVSERSGGRPPTVWAIELQLVRTLISGRREAEALDRVGRLRQAALRRPLPCHVGIGLDEVEIDCRLAVGDLDGASRILKDVPLVGRNPVVSARVDLCAGRPDRAVGRLTATPIRRLGVGAEVDRLVLLARAELQLGNRRRAGDATRRALEGGRPEHVVRPFVEHAPELVDLLKDIAGQFPDIYLVELLAHIDHAGGPRRGAAQSLEPLTDREREVLSQLTGHLTQHEIAGTMFVSVNTVKSHVKRVYRKLGAGSRSEAVALARAHGLL
jgi:LuxR family maltose regulon positive regulatory protein